MDIQTIAWAVAIVVCGVAALLVYGACVVGGWADASHNQYEATDEPAERALPPSGNE